MYAHFLTDLIMWFSLAAGVIAFAAAIAALAFFFTVKGKMDALGVGATNKLGLCLSTPFHF